ncbi:hypothetical protein C8Q72DRAFT_191458 [Fomitopsis betulina]|nr:hypothetical protein C8Q72DRAFT_191458 [Fomitopsis betulina]
MHADSELTYSPTMPIAVSSSAHPKCNICNIGFEDLAAYNIHIIYGHGFFVCGKCPSVSCKIAKLKGHYEGIPAHGSDFNRVSVSPVLPAPPCSYARVSGRTRGNTCSRCGKAFKKRKLLNKHVKEEHMQNKNIQEAHAKRRCTTCKTFIKDGRQFQKHMSRGHQVPARPQTLPQLAAPGYVDSMRLEAERSSEEPEESDGSIDPDLENDGASAMVETHEQVRPRIMRKALSETNVGNLQAEAEGEGYDMI